MKITGFSPFKHLEYVQTVLQVPISKATRGLVATDTNGTPVGVVLLDNWSENSVMGHIAVQSPIALRDLLPEAFSYVFNFCQKGMMLGCVPADVVKALKLNAHIGFKEIYRIKDGWDVGIDTVMLQMLKADCKYITKIKEVA
jgi:hypothetical protein